MKRLFSVLSFFFIIITSCRTGPELVVKDHNSAEKTVQHISGHPPVSDTVEDYMSQGRYSKLNDGEKSVLIEEIIDSMTIQEKIGQLFILAIRHTAYGKPALTVDETVSAFVKKYNPGGIILFSLNFESPGQTMKFIDDLQELSAYPLFITTDEEGGKVSRLGKSAEMDVISLPPAAEIGVLPTSAFAEKAAEVLGMDMRELGFNMNMAPVADVVVPGEYNPIGNRSYGSDPETTGSMTAATVRGFMKAGISPVLKHFPGHGNVGGDSHNGAVTSRSSRDEFYNRDFIPFIRGIEAGCDFVMVGHISAPALSGKVEPASLSYDIQTGILREKLRYQGIIITDAMDMGAIKNNYPPETAALKAFMAGTDIILMPENIPLAQNSILKALEDGKVTMNRLEDSLRRILKVKMNAGLFDLTGNVKPDYDTISRIERHKLLINQLNSQ